MRADPKVVLWLNISNVAPLSSQIQWNISVPASLENVEAVQAGWTLACDCVSVSAGA